MRTILTWGDLTPYGIVPLPDRACGLGYRILCDLTAKGKQTLKRALSVQELFLDPPRQAGPPESPHVGSIMLAPGMLTFLGLFALLEWGADEVFLTTDQRMTGFNPNDLPTIRQFFEDWYRDEVIRQFACRGTVQERELHYRLDRVV